MLLLKVEHESSEKLYNLADEGHHLCDLLRRII